MATFSTRELLSKSGQASTSVLIAAATVCKFPTFSLRDLLQTYQQREQEEAREAIWDKENKRRIRNWLNQPIAQKNWSKNSARLSVLTFPTQDGKFSFPEANRPELREKENIGFAFSGGGLRSASLTLGFLRGIHLLKLDRKIRYMAVISGGAWAASPYIYLPLYLEDDDFLGPYVPPSEFTTKASANGKSHIDIINQTNNLMGYTLARANLPLVGLKALGRIIDKNQSSFSGIIDIVLARAGLDEAFTESIDNQLLRPFGLDRKANPRYLGWKPETTDPVMRRNESLEKNDFQLVGKNRPFLIINGAMNQDWWHSSNSSSLAPSLGYLEWFHIEFTPIYTGIHTHSKGAWERNIGGGYVENIGFDATDPDANLTNDEQKFTEVIPGNSLYRLTLSDVMSCSGAAPALFVTTLGEKVLKRNVGFFPRFNYWPVKFFLDPDDKERAFGDGGYVDSYGIIPLLKRQVKSIVVCINTPEALKENNIKENDIKENDPWPEGIQHDTFLGTLFGIDIKHLDLVNPTNYLNRGEEIDKDENKYKKGQVLSNKVSVDKYSDYGKTLEGLCCAKELDALKPNIDIPGPITEKDLAQLGIQKEHISEEQWGKYVGRVKGPIYHLGTYRVMENEFFGIENSYDVKILWIYNERSETYFQSLPLDVRQRVESDVQLEAFPHYGTFHNGWPDNAKSLGELIFEHGYTPGTKMWLNQIDRIQLVDVNEAQVNLMSNYACWQLLKLCPIIEELREFART